MNCKIVQDLLPLYHDGVCSEESRAAVEEHLAGCESCRQQLTDMDAPLPAAEEEKREEDRPGVAAALAAGASDVRRCCSGAEPGWVCHLLLRDPV